MFINYVKKLILIITIKSLIKIPLPPSPWRYFFKFILVNNRLNYNLQRRMQLPYRVFKANPLMTRKLISFLDKAFYLH